MKITREQVKEIQKDMEEAVKIFEREWYEVLTVSDLRSIEKFVEEYAQRLETESANKTSAEPAITGPVFDAEGVPEYTIRDQEGVEKVEEKKESEEKKPDETIVVTNIMKERMAQILKEYRHGVDAIECGISHKSDWEDAEWYEQRQENKHKALLETIYTELAKVFDVEIKIQVGTDMAKLGRCYIAVENRPEEWIRPNMVGGGEIKPVTFTEAKEIIEREHQYRQSVMTIYQLVPVFVTKVVDMTIEKKFEKYVENFKSNQKQVVTEKEVQEAYQFNEWLVRNGWSEEDRKWIIDRTYGIRELPKPGEKDIPFHEELMNNKDKK